MDFTGSFSIDLLLQNRAISGIEKHSKIALLQDATFSVCDFADALQDNDVQRVLRAYPETISMEIQCSDSGLWAALPEKPYARNCKIQVNSEDILGSDSDKLNGFIGEYRFSFMKIVNPKYSYRLLVSNADSCERL